MKNIQTIKDAGGAIIGQACENCEIEIEEGCEIAANLPAETENAICFRCGEKLENENV